MKSNTPISSFKRYREICVYLFKFIYAVGCCTIRALQQLDEGDKKYHGLEILAEIGK